MQVRSPLSSLLVGGFMLAASQQAQAAVTLDMAMAYPPGNYHVKSAELFSAEVSKATAGEVTIKVQAGGALGLKGPEMLGAIRNGLVPIGSMTMPQQVGVEPMMGLVSLPYLVSTPEQRRKIAELARPTFDSIAKKHNQKILYIIPWPGQNIFAKAELKTANDFRSLKIRTVDRNGSDYFRSLGAAPAQMPWGEVVPALATGVINGVTTSSTSGVDGQFWEFMTICHLVNWQTNFEMVSINLDAWNKLSPAHQKAIEDLTKKYEPEFWKVAEADDAVMLKLLSDKGIKLVEPSDAVRALLLEKAIPTWTAFADKTPGAADLIAKYRAEVKK